jgi:chitin synthase
MGSRDADDPTFVPPDPRRTSTSKWADLDDVRLASGNLVLNCPLPSSLMDKIPRKAPLEFSCMRYSAATCDPSEFVQERFALRQQLFGQPRQTELFIVVTMYSEDEILFANTMIGVFKNIEHMCTKAKDSQWGENGWKKIVVCVVSDGRQKIDPKTRSLLAAMGCYQEGIAKLKVNDKPVQAHIYEVRFDSPS